MIFKLDQQVTVCNLERIWKYFSCLTIIVFPFEVFDVFEIIYIRDFDFRFD